MPCTTIVFLSYFNDYIEINYSTIKDITSLRLCCTGGDFRVSNQSCGFWDLPVDCVWLWAVWEDDIWCSTKSRPGVEPRIVIAYKRGSIDGCVTSPHPSPGLRTSRCNSSSDQGGRKCVSYFEVHKFFHWMYTFDIYFASGEFFYVNGVLILLQKWIFWTILSVRVSVTLKIYKPS